MKNLRKNIFISRLGDRQRRQTKATQRRRWCAGEKLSIWLRFKHIRTTPSPPERRRARNTVAPAGRVIVRQYDISFFSPVLAGDKSARFSAGAKCGDIAGM
jgi:hypothetical protein